jgi:hypothetical protein
MGLRDLVQNQRNATTFAAFGAILVAAIAIAFELRGNSIPKISKAYYSDDDGKTSFVDDVDKLVPFDHDGKQACQAYLFKCSDGTVFIGYLSRYTDKAKAELEYLRTQPPAQAAEQITEVTSAGTEVKRPGDTRWYRQNSPEGGEVLAPKCPNGGTLVEGMTP